VKNITVTVPDDVYRQARIKAAEQGTSVSGLVTDYLERLSTQEAEFARLAARQEEVRRTVTQFRASDRLDREQLHDRAVR
jgi:predicted CopG family antitoxin